ncbi:MAG: NAD(P)-dependent oxidoreductase [Clostridia bacterium]|nr:NAD(P)-dependent oxidoreductase [Clostridia bacterium]
MAYHVLTEAKRCLNCKKPMCRQGCPINTPISDMIHTLLDGDIDKAGKMLFENNPLSMICSLVCNHENQCEGHCVLNRKGAPVHASVIENYISTYYFDRLKFGHIEKNGKKVAIIGSGPAGIAIALILAQRGYDITIFEGRERIGGVLRYGIPEFRLPKSILDKYKEKLYSLGVKIRPNTMVGSGITIDDLFRDGYKAVFIGIGVWRPNTLRIKGESLGHVHYAINYLTNPDVYRLGEKLAIIGAGNSAMDVARTALRHRVREVTVYSRHDFFAASDHEINYAKLEGVEFKVHVEPVEIVDNGCIFADLDCDGHGTLTRRPGSERLEKADSVIIAISQGADNALVAKTGGLDTNDRGLLITNTFGETTRDGIFASGDVVSGARTVVEAVAYSKKVADAIDEYIQGLDKQGEEKSE